MCCISRVRVCGIFFFLICSLILKYFYELCTHIIFFKRETKDAEHVFLFLHHSLSTLSFSLNHFPISLCLSNTHTHTHTHTHIHTHTKIKRVSYISYSQWTFTMALLYLLFHHQVLMPHLVQSYHQFLLLIKIHHYWNQLLHLE